MVKRRRRYQLDEDENEDIKHEVKKLCSLRHTPPEDRYIPGVEKWIVGPRGICSTCDRQCDIADFTTDDIETNWGLINEHPCKKLQAVIKHVRFSAREETTGPKERVITQKHKINPSDIGFKKKTITLLRKGEYKPKNLPLFEDIDNERLYTDSHGSEEYRRRKIKRRKVLRNHIRKLKRCRCK